MQVYKKHSEPIQFYDGFVSRFRKQMCITALFIKMYK